jgi:hypothetical protein
MPNSLDFRFPYDPIFQIVNLRSYSVFIIRYLIHSAHQSGEPCGPGPALL